MTSEQRIIIYALLISVAAFIAAICWFIVRQKKICENYYKSGVSTALGLSGFLIVAIWGIRFAAGYSDPFLPGAEGPFLTVGEEIVNSIFGALRTFSMEEEYSEYIVSVRSMVAFLFSGHHLQSRFSAITVLYASVLNFLAPVVGGAIILEVLAKAFPKIRLRLCYFSFWRKKCYFSKLNEASLELAKDIIKEEKKRPLLIFTDSYVDDEDEKEYELLLEAKRCGAICVRDDIVHIVKSKHGVREYYLMDENELTNLQTLIELSKRTDFDKTYVYLFIESDTYIQIEDQIRNSIKERYEKNNKKVIYPTVIPINSYRNLVCNLFCDVPLYEPLVKKADRSCLNITIFGNGIIGTEAFIGAYWFGRMLVAKNDDAENPLNECKLTINVVSRDTERSFWSKIDYLNPEIKETVKVISSDSERCDDVVSPEDSWKYYCQVTYVQQDVKRDGFLEFGTKDSRNVLNSDYFIVALGNDADNISVANKLFNCVGKQHFEAEDAARASETVIAYAVFDSNLAATLNKKKLYSTYDKDRKDIYMYAFGSLRQVYSCNNIHMLRYSTVAAEADTAYSKQLNRSINIANNISRVETGKDIRDTNYNYWASLARVMHLKYKVFSCGWIDFSVFDYAGGDDKAYEKAVKDRCNKYKSLAIFSNINSGELSDVSLCADDKRKYDEMKAKREQLAWLEHRRWCAFCRTMGYRYTGKVRRNFDINGKTHKNMALKLHPCLREVPIPHGSTKYLNEDVADLFKSVKNNTNSKYKDILETLESDIANVRSEHIDTLDDLACEVLQTVVQLNAKKDCVIGEGGEREIRTSYFKRYDCYEEEFGEYATQSGVIEVLNKNQLPKRLVQALQRKIFTDDLSVRTECGVQKFVSVTEVKSFLKTKYIMIDPKNEYEYDLCKYKKIPYKFSYENCFFVKKSTYRCYSVLRNIKNRFTISSKTKPLVCED